ncbi:DUF305 domain-containing protein [Nonomuraea jiangxiensis]|uniref:Uncharacterized conserved protein, DUF305 family n=1 Tax=Nonomuraea jiangxiensis TaxID=633440 RepID=A0A1G8NH72_9ACTN|nr:DUF305 domain-containing protein [Nonomuraea jiangxiensis]SDI79505.1 Uncharacterized conserved protein, DUF305 family [Nonomuraea jiangxiensis]
MIRAFVFLLLSVLLLGCSAAAGAPPSAPTPGTASAPSSGTASGARFTTTDVAWLQLADALHARALPLLALVPERSGDRELAELAVRLRKEHETGRGRLRALLARTGVTGENPHAQHDMPGMPTADDLRALTALRDDAFDRRFVTLVRAHLDQLVLVAKGEQTSGGAPEARKLAAAMERDHAAALAELERAGDQ